MKNFTHLHVHTEYSVLDGASKIKNLIDYAKELGMKSLAITDHGNMFGVKDFHKYALKKDIKPIIGCEVYVAKGSRKSRKDKNDRGYHLILLAKNLQGYHNLVKLVSYSWTEGFYYNPRIDKELLEKYHDGLIASSACLGGEISQLIMDNDIEQAKESISFYKSLFGDDYYLEMMLHESGDPKIDDDVFKRQIFVNEKLIELSSETGVKLIVTNDVHFVKAEDADAHDHLICINTAKDINDPDRLRYTRQEYLKSPEEMYSLFPDCVEALENTMEIAEKVEVYELDNKPIMPDFPIPAEFKSQDEYLEHLCYKGAEKRYGKITPEVKERLDFELSVIERMGYPGYFLIVNDFLNAAREMGVSVGPGRGSAAGSVVSYCLYITDIDPIKYNLLFERFLNPDRISLPDIDIDFDEDGRDKVLKWVVSKYGEKRVAQIVTFGRMLPKMAIRDVARVQGLPLNDADRIAKLIPEKPGISFNKAYQEVPELVQIRNNGNQAFVNVLENAEKLEGTVRNVGIHACGVIIGKDDLENYIPICTSKDAELIVTQYEGSLMEEVGMLKMDFLGLKTLSIIKDCVENIKKSKGVDIDINSVPLDDKKTFELYSKGHTSGIFQFESPGMKKYLKELKPNRFEDLIAMNALYRPGPMEYIPNYINRKHGKEKIVYDHPDMEEYLKETYGITVYQEQVMLLAQKLAGFTKGEADMLRKAMGKKIKKMLDELKTKFIDGCIKNNIKEDTANKIWSDWEAFAQYAFNKSHSTCYAYVSYQTAYLKAHYPAEFMAAVLSRNLNEIKKISFLMDECRRMGLKVLGPDINESELKFNVNKKGEIRFGLGAIKGVGEAAVENIITERNNKGDYKDIYDFVERVNLQAVNKKTIEALVMAGCLDNLSDIKRYQYFAVDNNNVSFIENIIRYGNKIQAESNTMQQSLFGDTVSVDVVKPQPVVSEEWSIIEKLDKEKEVVGMYISAHPLDKYKLELDNICNITLNKLANLKDLEGKEISAAGIITSAEERISKTGNPYGSFTLEDFSGSYKHTLFSNDYLNFKKYLTKGYMVYFSGKVKKVERKDRQPEHRLFIEDMKLLEDVRKNIKRIVLKISIDILTDELIKELEQYVKNNTGKTSLEFLIYNPEDKIYVEMFSRSNNVYLSDDFIEYLQNNSDIEFKIFN